MPNLRPDRDRAHRLVLGSGSRNSTRCYRVGGTDKDYMRFSAILRRAPSKREDVLLYALLQAHFIVYPWSADDDG